jgi:spore maturation protein CgeB
VTDSVNADLLIVGNAGGTNVGASLHRAAERDGIASFLCDARAATRGPRLFSSLSWRLLGHRPLHLHEFSRAVVEQCIRSKPRVLIATGQAPLNAASLAEIGRLGIRRINYSTDDPWNPGFQARWFAEALTLYDKVFTVRRSNIADFKRHGCKDVSYLPFGYDETLWAKDRSSETECASAPADVFFAGAAESYRIECMRALLAGGIRVAVAGDYWKRTPGLRKSALGPLNAANLRSWTLSTPVSLCLVRRANRDGHVMRSFEIPAIGACMVVEDTAEHRDIFGADGETVRYFGSLRELVAVVKELLRDSAARTTLARAAHALICAPGNSYGDRLRAMLLSTPLSSAPTSSARSSRDTAAAFADTGDPVPRSRKARP